MKKVITIIVLVLVIAGAITLSVLSKRVNWNDENAPGNTSGNLLNGGEFCEYDGKIYFSNYLDEGTLYVMNDDLSDAEKIKDDIVTDLNVCGDYIVYSRRNNRRSNVGSIFIFDNMGAYRINKSGGRLVQLFDDYTGMVHQYGNYVYYQHYAKKEILTLYRVKLDNTEEKQLSKEAIMPTAIVNGTLYYCGVENDHNIHAMNLSNGSEETIFEGNCANCIECNGYIYFMDLEHNNGISRIRTDGSDYEVLVPYMVSTYNISTDGSVLYFQTDGADVDHYLGSLTLKSGREKVIRTGDHNSINVTEHYIFFKDFHTENYYYIDDAGNLNPFQPDVEE